MKQKNQLSIRIIEQPENDEMHQQELSEILGGWNCGSYTKRIILKDKCREWDSLSCANPNSGENYCGKYNSILKKV